jgi:AcrR family transcriptional regulator
VPSRDAPEPGDAPEQIVEVAASHFAREGFEGLSVPAIAADADVTRALVYHYFPGQQLFVGVGCGQDGLAVQNTCSSPTCRASSA